jgi:hypothetical protein
VGGGRPRAALGPGSLGPPRGLAPGVEAEIAQGRTEGGSGGSLALGATARLYLSANRLALAAAPVLLRLETAAGERHHLDLAGRFGLVVLLGRIELGVESPPLSYLARARWHARPFSVRLGLLLD